MKIETILVPTDFSDDAGKALEVATDIAKDFGSRIVLLHAYHIDLPFTSPGFGGPVILPSGFYVDFQNNAIAQVEALAKSASGEGVEVSGIAIERPAWLAILDHAEEISADLIVIGTRGLTGLKHVAFGSTAERVVRSTKCPVLTVKSD